MDFLTPGHWPGAHPASETVMMQLGFRKPSGMAPGQQADLDLGAPCPVGSRASDLFLPPHPALPVHPRRRGQGRPSLQPLPLCLMPHASHPLPLATARIGPGSPLQLAPGSTEAAENRNRWDSDSHHWEMQTPLSLPQGHRERSKQGHSQLGQGCTAANRMLTT